MKTFMFKLTRAHLRTGEPIGVMVGVVQAENYEAASDKAWERYGSDASYGFEMWDIKQEDGEPIMTAFMVYKSEIYEEWL